MLRLAIRYPSPLSAIHGHIRNRLCWSTPTHLRFITRKSRSELSLFNANGYGRPARNHICIPITCVEKPSSERFVESHYIEHGRLSSNPKEFSIKTTVRGFAISETNYGKSSDTRNKRNGNAIHITW